MRAISGRQVRGLWGITLLNFYIWQGREGRFTPKWNPTCVFFFVAGPHVDGGPAGRHNHSGVSQWGRNPPHANTMEITWQHCVSELLIWCSADSAVQLDSGRLMLILMLILTGKSPMTALNNIGPGKYHHCLPDLCVRVSSANEKRFCYVWGRLHAVVWNWWHAKSMNPYETTKDKLINYLPGYCWLLNLDWNKTAAIVGWRKHWTIRNKLTFCCASISSAIWFVVWVWVLVVVLLF